MSRAIQVSVIGAATGDDELLADAESVGRLLAESGAAVVCGGGSGVMEAASRGARSAGGDVIGILRGEDASREANEFVTHVVATGTGHARNLAVVASGDAVIAVGGEWGTLSEIAFARKLGRNVVALDSWSLRNRAHGDLGITEAETPEQAVEAALQGVRRA